MGALHGRATDQADARGLRARELEGLGRDGGGADDGPGGGELWVREGAGSGCGGGVAGERGREAERGGDGGRGGEGEGEECGEGGVEGAGAVGVWGGEKDGGFLGLVVREVKER